MKGEKYWVSSVIDGQFPQLRGQEFLPFLATYPLARMVWMMGE